MVALAVDSMILESFSNLNNSILISNIFDSKILYVLESCRTWIVPISRAHPSTPELKELLWFLWIIGRGRRIQSSSPSSSPRLLCKLEL